MIFSQLRGDTLKNACRTTASTDTRLVGGDGTSEGGTSGDSSSGESSKSDPPSPPRSAAGGKALDTVRIGIRTPSITSTDLFQCVLPENGGAGASFAD